MKWFSLQAPLIALMFLSFDCHPSAEKEADPQEDLLRTPGIWKILGTSSGGAPIYFYDHGMGDSIVLVLGGTHGDEQVGGQIVVNLAELVSKTESAKQHIVFVPFLNPDGVEKQTRTNANGVDINRNFPTKNWSPVASKDRYSPGPSPSSEPETRIVLDLISHYNPRLIISIHGGLHMINYDGPAKEIAERMATHNGYRVSDSIGYPTPGSLGTYAGVERGIPIITLELPPVAIDEAWEQNRDALVEAVSR